MKARVLGLLLGVALGLAAPAGAQTAARSRALPPLPVPRLEENLLEELPNLASRYQDPELKLNLAPGQARGPGGGGDPGQPAAPAGKSPTSRPGGLSTYLGNKYLGSDRDPVADPNRAYDPLFTPQRTDPNTAPTQPGLGGGLSLGLREGIDLRLEGSVGQENDNSLAVGIGGDF